MPSVLTRLVAFASNQQHGTSSPERDARLGELVAATKILFDPLLRSPWSPLCAAVGSTCRVLASIPRRSNMLA